MNRLLLALLVLSPTAALAQGHFYGIKGSPLGGTAVGDLNMGGTYDVYDLAMLDFTKQTIAADDATPDVAGGTVFVTSANTGATAITDFDNPRVGQHIILCGGSNTNSSTIANSGNFTMKGGAFVAAVGYCITFRVNADNDYVELGRSPSRKQNVKTIAFADTNYALLIGEDLILCNATDGATVVIPPAATAANTGYVWCVKKTDASANSCTIDPAANIDGAASKTNTTQYQSFCFANDGTNYFIF